MELKEKVQKIKAYELSQKCINKNLPSAFKFSTGKRKGMPSGTRVVQEESRLSPKPNALCKRDAHSTQDTTDRTIKTDRQRQCGCVV